MSDMLAWFVWKPRVKMYQKVSVAVLKVYRKWHKAQPSPGALPYSKKKVRSMDDCKASAINASVTQTKQASIHTIDHIAAMIAMFSHLGTCDGHVGKQNIPNSCGTCAI